MSLTIPRRFCGPPESGNGGWVSGQLAEHTPTTVDRPAVSVRLSSPPPLERPLTYGGYGSVTLLQDGSTGIASATTAPALDSEPAPPVDLGTARAAEAGYEGLIEHPFPTCFSCGTDRDPADALCLRPGPLADGTTRYAASWVPWASDLPLVWAALDCPGGWSAGIAGRPMVLGTMTAQIEALPVVGEPHVIVARPRGGEGRKFLSESFLYTADGRLLARAEATWIAVNPSDIRPRGAS